ncbi:hypothetical protein RY831_24040 [Noviherbaspirillum sp. CPCC 100848]|uniref:Uncharacterized protein n=1 Tax=Noviherbaspirillum album TaxID=3080276 RepID=A0ABU6JEZ8_9BURK|nr:hypothetical protein [Noviherbaspirillum sp. CPCC 100848]MEC4722239.1 hypothetical protein [Noviherbaspirillum sp. CPCC 100848]
MNRLFSRFAIPLVALAFSFSTAIAGPGHDHGDEAPVASSGSVSPRFEAHSDLFEVVGVFDGHELSVFVDQYADNAPVLKAKVELESGSTKAVGEFHEDSGDYKFVVKSFEKPGKYPVTLTVTAGDEVDILAANLVIPDGHAGEDHAHGNDASSPLYQRIGFGAAALIVLALLTLGVRRWKLSRNAGGLK